MSELKRTPLYEKHRALDARMVPFGGWEMPVQYGGIMEEHEAVRTAVGLFDVSHMGEFEVHGPATIDFLNYLCANDATRLSPGDAQYTMLLNEQGGTIDDIIIYRLEDNRALMVPNAANIDRDWEHVSAVAAEWEDVTVQNRSDAYALLALQGPCAVPLLNGLTDIDVSGMGYYTIRPGWIDDTPVLVARTGYTGEDGFELFVASEQSPDVWDRLLAAGEPYGIKPAGLGARDSLRLEASLPLYGHELDESTSPLEAGLGYFVKKEGDYIGADRQRELREKGLERKLVMLKLTGRGIAREGYEVQDEDGNPIGRVASGSMAPHLKEAIAQAFVKTEYARVGGTVKVLVRGRPVAAEIVKRPFYRRSGS